MLVKELINILQDLEPNAPISVVDKEQGYEFEIVETCTCDDDKNFLDIIIDIDSLLKQNS